MKALLKKYIQHVGMCEGVDFLEDDYERTRGEVEFTDEEWATLRALADEVDEERRRAHAERLARVVVGVPETYGSED
jgi:hypothetical protein